MNVYQTQTVTRVPSIVELLITVECGFCGDIYQNDNICVINFINHQTYFFTYNYHIMSSQVHLKVTCYNLVPVFLLLHFTSSVRRMCGSHGSSPTNLVPC